MSGILQNKVSVVTGGGDGIGRASCLKFAAYGAKVVVADRDMEGAEETVRLISAAGGEAAAIRVDIVSESEVEQMVAFTLKRFGRLDCALNNAGVGFPPVPVAEQEEEIWRKALDIDLLGAALCMKHELRHMIEAGGGVIVNMSSLAGKIGTPGRAPYAASKAGVISITQAAALENAQKGIRVNAICPGVILTRHARAWAAKGVDFIKDLHVPMGRGGEPEEIAELAAWLASPLSSYITGQAICADGGQSVR